MDFEQQRQCGCVVLACKLGVAVRTRSDAKAERNTRFIRTCEVSVVVVVVVVMVVVVVIVVVVVVVVVVWVVAVVWL